MVVLFAGAGAGGRGSRGRGRRSSRGGRCGLRRACLRKCAGTHEKGNAEKRKKIGFHAGHYNRASYFPTTSRMTRSRFPPRNFFTSFSL